MQVQAGLDASLTFVAAAVAAFLNWIADNGSGADWLTAFGVPLAVLGGMSRFLGNQREARERQEKQWRETLEREDAERRRENERLTNRSETLATLMLHIGVRTGWAAQALKAEDASLWTVSHILEKLRHYNEILRQLDLGDLEKAAIIAPWDDFTVTLIEACHGLHAAFDALKAQDEGADIRSDLSVISDYLGKVSKQLDQFLLAIAEGIGLDQAWVARHQTALEERAKLGVEAEPGLEQQLKEARLVAHGRRSDAPIPVMTLGDL
jgi:hypothetical protein